jgi:glutamate racemase
LATAATVRRDYTQDLIREFAGDCRVKLVGSERLASLAEAALRGEPVADADIKAEIEPCFADDRARTDTVVLACTHYPLLIDRLRQLAPWPVEWIDPAPAIARRASSLLGAPGPAVNAPVRAHFTSGRAPTRALLDALTAFGVTAGEPAAAAV